MEHSADKTKTRTQSRAAVLSTDVRNSFFTTYIKLLDRNSLVNYIQRIFYHNEADLSTDPCGNKAFILKQSRKCLFNFFWCKKSYVHFFVCVYLWVEAICHRSRYGKVHPYMIHRPKVVHRIHSMDVLHPSGWKIKFLNHGWSRLCYTHKKPDDHGSHFSIQHS